VSGQAEPVAVPAPTATEQKKAAAEVEVARLDADAAKWRATLADFLAECEARFLEGADVPVGAVASEAAREEEMVKKLASLALGTLLDRLSPWAIGVAVQTIVDAEAEQARVTALATAMRERAEKRCARVRNALWPLVEAWAEANRPAKGKTIRFESTEARVQFRAHDGSLSVLHRGKAVQALKAALGVDAWQCIRVEEEVSLRSAREVIEAKGVDPARLEGFKWCPAGERVTLIKGKGGGDGGA
jgi:hypothetical protein